MPFYVPEDPLYTIFDSAADSLRFTTTRCLTTYRGHTCATSTFVNMTGEIMHWHDFGPLEGPGWAANAVGGAWELIQWARFTGRRNMERTALSVLDHVLENGFIDEASGLIKGYRHTGRDEIVLNFKHNGDWFCPGSNARVAVQMLQCADLDPVRRPRLERAAVGYARWLKEHLQMLPGGWFPRRCDPAGRHYDRAAEGGQEPLLEVSADGLFILQLWTELSERRLMDCRRELRKGLDCFRAAGGFYGSINHDTYDRQESVAYAVAFRTLRAAARVLDDPALAAWALQHVLPGLERFKMMEDRNGVRTTGLLYMEDTWDTAYLWENAHAALAWLEAYTDTRSVRYLNDALTVLRAIARHHHGPHGFLTEGVDWNNHVSARHHFDGAEFGDIQYTEPFLNNQHIVEPTLYFLQRHADMSWNGPDRVYHDHENNVVAILPSELPPE